jgi:hypothetical protein
MRRVSKCQKRVRATPTKTAKSRQITSAARKKLRAKALHLLLGLEHFIDRAAAEKLRQFPNVPRKLQQPFPRDVEVGFAGHYKGGKFTIQGREDFILDFEANADNSWYLRTDKRGNRKPRREDAGMYETNAALSTGLSRVLADLVRDGRLNLVRNTVQLASEAGMSVVRDHTGYLPGYLSVHPDAEGTLSTHYGAWTVDPEQRKLLGISATGKRGRKGSKNLGSSFISILRHNRAIGLPPELTRMPKKNLEERTPLDWAISEEMDRVVRAELCKLPNGRELMERADEYQREAAEDWLRRFAGTKVGVDRHHAELAAAKKRIAELEATLTRQNDKKRPKKKLLSLGRGISEVRKLAGFIGGLCKDIGRLVMRVNRAFPAIELTYSRPAWMTSNAKSAHMTNPQNHIGPLPKEPRESAIAFENVQKPQVFRAVADSSSIETEPVKPQEPCQESKSLGTKKTNANLARAPMNGADQQMSM